MSKRLVLNGVLALVVIGLAVGTFVKVRSSSSTAATTQTYATAKRGVVLQSVSSTGNVEASTDLGLSFQQSGEVKVIYVSVGDHVESGYALAKVDDTQQKIALASAQASLASAQASLAGLKRGETAIERQADDASAVAAAQSVTSAQLGLTQSQQNATNNVTKYQQAIDESQQSLNIADAGVATAHTQLNQANAALRSLQNTYDPSHSTSEAIAATLTRYRLDQVSCANHSTDPTYKPSDGVTCAQVANLLTFAQSVQTAQSGLTTAEGQQSSAQSAVTTAKQGKTSGEMQDQQAIQNAQAQVTSAQQQYNSTLISNAVKQEAPKPEELAQSQAAVVSAQAQVATAQKNEDDTTLRAPVAGTVASVNGMVGQQSGSASASSRSSSGNTSSAARAHSLRGCVLSWSVIKGTSPIAKLHPALGSRSRP